MPQNDPTVSIIIPCYNAARYVGEAIESALLQTYRNKEIIVVDDGSTDCTIDVVRSYGDRIRWISGPNRGGGAARNRGLELARGELIQFLDADDILHPQKLERQVERAIRDKSTIVYSNYATQSEDNVCTALQSPICDGMDPVVFVLMKAGLQTSAPLHWRTHLLSVSGFRENLPCAQERDLHLRLACAGLRFQHLPEILHTVRRRRISLSSDSIRVLDQHSSIAWHAYKLLSDSGQLTEERRAAVAGFLAGDARAYLQCRLPDKAKDYFAQARRIHPDGGIPQAYSPRTRWLVRTLGPSLTQRLARYKRALAPTRLPLTSKSG